MNNRLAVVIVNFNGANDTVECVKSIKENCGFTEKVEIIIVDNNSKEEDKKILVENLKEHKLILNPQNSGFAIANNIGIDYAMKNEFESILLLNNDTLIEKESFEIMESVLYSDKNIGAVSCSILYNAERDKIWFDGGNINWKTFLSSHDNMRKKYIPSKEITDVNFISGCCLMLKREVIEKVGMLPTDYFMYFEDTDFSAKITEAGYKMKIAKEAVIYHKVSASTGGEESNFVVEWGNRNRIIFMKKYKYKSSNSFGYFKSNLYFFSTRGVKIIQYIIKGNKEKAKFLVKGVKSGLKYKKNIE